MVGGVVLHESNRTLLVRPYSVLLSSCICFIFPDFLHLLFYFPSVWFFLLFHFRRLHSRGIAAWNTHLECIASQFSVVYMLDGPLYFFYFHIMLRRWVITALNTEYIVILAVVHIIFDFPLCQELWEMF